MSPQKSGMLICEHINESSFIIIQPTLMPQCEPYISQCFYPYPYRTFFLLIGFAIQILKAVTFGFSGLLTVPFVLMVLWQKLLSLCHLILMYICGIGKIITLRALDESFIWFLNAQIKNITH